MEDNEFEKVPIKNSTCYDFNDIIKLEDFDIDNILIEEQSHKNNLIYKISYKTLIVSKPLRIRFDKIERFIRIYDRTTILAKIYETNFRVSVKWRTTGKVEFQFLNSFLLVLTKFPFWEEDWTPSYNSMNILDLLNIS